MGNFKLYHHFSETAGFVHEYLKMVFGTDTVEVREFGADLTVYGGKAGEDGIDVEVKSCREFTNDSCANGSRRRGRFHFQHPIKANHILFVLFREDGNVDLKIGENLEEWINGRSAINHKEIFS